MRDLSLYSRQPPIKTLPKTVIVDIDGTICDIVSALPHLYPRQGFRNEDAFYEAVAHCDPYPHMLGYLKAKWNQGFALVVITSRPEKYRDMTLGWLTRVMPVPFDGPFMAEDGDCRPPAQIKGQIVDTLSPTYDFQIACEDNPDVVKAWKARGMRVVLGPGHKEWDNPRWK